VKLKHLYEGSIKNVYKSVLLGKAVAGVTLDVDLAGEPAEIADQVRIIMRTPEMAAHPLSVHPRVPQKVRQAVAEAVLKMGKKDETAEVFKNIRMPEPVAADYERDYRALEEIDIDKLNAEGM
jgi:phosphonate transport system substrate-binding protein